jgi:hypothetical protein
VNILIHEDNTHRDIRLKLFLAVSVIIFLAAALSFLGNNKIGDALAMFILAGSLVIIFSIIIPRHYLIFDDRVKIRFAGPLSFTIPFSTINKVGTAGRVSFGLNFPSSLSSSHAVGILRKRRLAVYITPDDRELFIKKLEKAINDWIKDKVSPR